MLQKNKNIFFAFKINYNTLDNEQTEVKKLYNGNIAETRWRTNFDNLTRSYGYTYDELNRLTNAQYVRPSNPYNPNPADVIDTFNEKLSYDKNGNIQSLVRNGGMESQTTVPIMDVLTYQYDANTKNKLIKVTDATANTEGFKDGADTTEEYGYDPNGNMTRDDNKNIVSIVYNHLNLPSKIVFQNGGDFPSISYLYTATGKKVAKTVNIASRNTINYTVDYLDGYQYESGKLLFFPTAEGYVKYTYGVTNPFDYVFNYTDHLGNIRLSYGINPATQLLTKIEENNYYPFGLKHGSYNTEAKIIVKHQPINGLETGSLDKLMVQKTDVLAEEMERPPLSTNSNPEFYSGYNYKFQNKEWQDELSLNLHDFNARLYDPASVRTPIQDPLSEKFYSTTPYSFLNNNPIRFIDPDGREAKDFVQRKDGSIYWDNNANNQATTKSGETYLGKNLSFTFNSYIGSNYDGPLGSLPEGDKLTTTINLSAIENSSGELTGLSTTKTTVIGKTFGMFQGRDYYPGKGGSNNYFTQSGMSINYEQHASVPSFEEGGLNSMGFKIVDVAQKLNINYNNSNGNLSVSAYTDVFPSATLKLNNTGGTLMNYTQPSFIGTHTAPITGWTHPNPYKDNLGPRPIRDFSYYPSVFYKRN